MGEVSGARKQESVEKSLTVDETIAKIVKPEGPYTILYGSHDKVQDPTKIPSDSTFLMLETGSFDYVDTSVDESVTILQKSKQYSQLMQANESLQLPLCLTDASPRRAVAKIVSLNGYGSIPLGVFGLKTVVSATLMPKDHAREEEKRQKTREFYSDFPPEFVPEHVNESWQNDSKMSRRDFLNMGGKIAVGTWLTTPLVKYIAENILYREPAEIRDYEAINTFQRTIHPEEKVLDVISLTIRNLVIAHKNQLIMEGAGYSNPHMTSVMGALHYGLETASLASPEERIASLKGMQSLLKVVFRDSTFYTYAELKPVQQADGTLRYEKTTTEVPELKELVS